MIPNDPAATAFLWLVLIMLVLGVYIYRFEARPKKVVKSSVPRSIQFDHVDEHALGLGKPAAMNTTTLIEWLQRQLETPEEAQMRRHHAEIAMAASAPGYILRKTGIMFPNEVRDLQALYEHGMTKPVHYIGWSESINAIPTHSIKNVTYTSC